MGWVPLDRHHLHLRVVVRETHPQNRHGSEPNNKLRHINAKWKKHLPTLSLPH